MQTRDGVARFVVPEIDKDSIVSVEGRRSPRGEILQLKRQTTSGGRTAWLVVSVLYGIGVVLKLLL